jgi:DNA-binding response OmpR family regulator
LNQQAKFSDIRGDFCPVGRDGLLLMYRAPHIKTDLQRILDAHYRLELSYDTVVSLELLKSHEVALILIEANLFVEIGYDFCQQLKGQRWSRDIPIIVVGDRDPATSRGTAFDAGAQDYLSLPLLAEEVIARLQARLSDYRRGQQLSRAKSAATVCRSARAQTSRGSPSTKLKPNTAAFLKTRLRAFFKRVGRADTSASTQPWPKCTATGPPMS